ncbi:hypothetical protein MARBORIA2_14640 [Methanobrevibacter arboriphilus]|jgi:hypothetical protein|uniref:hypothetical protein n=1 Tax=Methanobrevibacter arboriphilus TaxID=39441 RepID=UPI0022EECAA3|nr:hypothetical protein [Methanobrevibacter arboriphilus]GLI12374.1 hypothetical protein MARBORIA2_14640 [Methanobrevibacter arboriphilus]
MLAKLNFHNDNELFYFDTTEQFKTTTSLKEYFNKIKVFIINDIVLSLQHYEIRELDSDFDRDVDVDVYCTKLSNVEDVQVVNKQKGLFDFKGGI